MSLKHIEVSKARVHNLRGVSVRIPKNTLTVVTGPSGSGKSSLAFNTIHVEAQRRYIESLSSYARQFLGQHRPPDVESITGLSPSIAIDQKSTSKNPRSTVGTVTEIYDYLRVLFARAGSLYDPDTGDLIRKDTPPQIARQLLSLPEGTRMVIMAPAGRFRKSALKAEIARLLSMGIARVRLDGEIVTLDEGTEPAGGAVHSLDAVVDRISVRPGIEKRLVESVEHALKMGGGNAAVLADGQGEMRFCEHNANPETGTVFPDLGPRLFSFNGPIGACPECKGLGESKNFDPAAMVVDEGLGVLEGAIGPLRGQSGFLYNVVSSILETEGVDPSTPLEKVPKRVRKILFSGGRKKYTCSFRTENFHYEYSRPFPGIPAWLEKKFRETKSERVRAHLEKYMNVSLCPSCGGKRLNPVALNTMIGPLNIMDVCSTSIEETLAWMEGEIHGLLDEEASEIAGKLIEEIKARLRFMIDVGLGYLSLDRAARTLSGGEAQRIRLATQIGSALTGILYILDEPSIGLHQRDNARLLKGLKNLRDIGNTVLVVEHDEETIREADFLVDMGPGAGIHGGRIVAQGPSGEVIRKGRGPTARFLNREETLPVPPERRPAKRFLHLKKARHNNLKDIDVRIPLNTLTCVTGVSGSGKSTLVHDVLVPACREGLGAPPAHPPRHRSLSGAGGIKSVIELDQSPIGRTPHSNPATYTKVFDSVRALYSQTPESQIRGYRPGRFSFNVKGGRCEECEGNGVKRIEMHFLPDVHIICTECKGTRFNDETLAVLYRGKNIAEILDLTIEEALEFFENHPSLRRPLSTLHSIGLGYMKLGQSATTLSGGEAQRLKLSRELRKRPSGECLYVLDEPTTGLHFQDVRTLLKAVNALVDQGHTVVVIEHNLDVVKSADWIVDLGPEGGEGGGQVVGTGTPEELAANKASWTGKYLKRMLGRQARGRRKGARAP